jgi:hypothetical protein
MPQFLRDRSLLVAGGIGVALGVAWLAFGGIGWVVVGIVLPWVLIWYGIGGRWAELALTVFLAGAVPLPSLASQAASSGLAREDLIRQPTFLVLGGAVILATVGLVTLVALAISGRRAARRTLNPPSQS